MHDVGIFRLIRHDDIPPQGIDDRLTGALPEKEFRHSRGPGHTHISSAHLLIAETQHFQPVLCTSYSRESAAELIDVNARTSIDMGWVFFG
jgi:hypothetical protein